MTFVSRWVARSLGLVLAAGVATGTALAAPTVVTVDAKSGPWDFSDTLNTGFKYGDPNAKDFQAPVVITLTSLGLAPGDSIGIQFIDGLTSAFGPPPVVGNLGHVGTIFKDDVIGNSGFNFPSLYVPSEWGVNQRATQDLNPPADPNDVIDPDQSGVFLNALLFAVIDKDGNIITVGSMGTTTVTPNSIGGTFGLGFLLPPDAAAISFGFNDDIFNDNAGALRVCVGSAAELDAVNPCGSQLDVPEPGSLALLSAALAGIGLVRRRRAA